MSHRPLVTVAMAVLLTAASLPDEDGFDHALAALILGNRAAESGDEARLRASALALRASAAQPIAGEDLAVLWLERAHAAPPPTMRDRALGPGYRSLRLGGGDTATFKQTFLAGQRARVAVVGLRQSDFLMRVREEESVPLCNASPRHPRCDWVPTYTTRFTIEIRNPGRSPGEYVVVMQ